MTDHKFDAEFWNGMYRRRGARSSERNAFLEEDLAGIVPGAALDVGCGEGADAIWLAERGWKVTAVDLSEVALERARAADAGHRVSWIQADLSRWEPPVDAFDLVKAHFIHVAPADRARLFGQLAAAVRPGGTFLFVAHHPSDHSRPGLPDLNFTAEEVAALLVPGRWEVGFSGTRARTSTHHGTVNDAVLKARRVE